MRQFINILNPDDTFSILDFFNTVRQLLANSLPNTSKNRTKALNYMGATLLVRRGVELRQVLEDVEG